LLTLYFLLEEQQFKFPETCHFAMEHLEQPTLDVELWITDDMTNYRLAHSPLNNDIEDMANKISRDLGL
jgi:hypothetical protein